MFSQKDRINFLNGGLLLSSSLSFLLFLLVQLAFSIL